MRVDRRSGVKARRGVSEILAAIILIVIVVMAASIIWAVYGPIFAGSSSNLQQQAGTAAARQLALLSNPYSYGQGGNANLYLLNYGKTPITVQVAEVETVSLAIEQFTLYNFPGGVQTLASNDRIMPGQLYMASVSLSGTMGPNYNVTLITDQGAFYFLFVAQTIDTSAVLTSPNCVGPNAVTTFTTTISNDKTSLNDIAEVDLGVNSLFSVSASQPTPPSGWAVTVTGNTIKWMANLATGGNGKGSTNAIDPGQSQTFSWTATAPSNSGSYQMLMTLDWVSNNQMPYVDTTGQAFTVSVSTSCPAQGGSESATVSNSPGSVKVGSTNTFSLNICNTNGNGHPDNIYNVTLAVNSAFTGVGASAPSGWKMTITGNTVDWWSKSKAIDPGACQALSWTATAPAVTGSYSSTVTLTWYPPNQPTPSATTQYTITTAVTT